MAEYSVNDIRERIAQSYNRIPKYQRFDYALIDARALLAEVDRLEEWTKGLQATALRWATESMELRAESERKGER